MISLNNKKIGIWGFGITGKSIISYLISLPCQLSVIDKKVYSTEEHYYLINNKINIFSYNQLHHFLEEHDVIFPSSGININDFKQFSHKFISEVDLFYTLWNKPTIAITGTLAKTSITTLLSETLTQQEKIIATGGNIGIPLLDLVKHKEYANYAIIELSSFQLEHAQLCNPTLAIWTNLYANHLDRHTTMEKYFEAKFNIIKYQNIQHHALLPLPIASLIKKQSWPLDRPCNYFSLHPPTKKDLLLLSNYDALFYLDLNRIIKITSKKTDIIYTGNFPPHSFHMNWLIIATTLHLLKEPIVLPQNATLPAHRLEFIGKYNNVSFYNDSKSSVMESTIMAVETLQGKPIILFLGGVSKGVNRLPFIEQLQNKVHVIFCFGSESATLAQACLSYKIPAFSFAHLDDAFNQAIHYAFADSIFLFSPGGASFDLFPDYQIRGNYFKQLVQKLYLRDNQ